MQRIESAKDDIKTIIYKLDPNKVYCHDMISICMFKMSGDFIIELFFAILKYPLKCGIFLADWKKENIVPIFKKYGRQNI